MSEEISYAVFAHRQWHGPNWSTIDQAKAFAKKIGLTCFGIYPMKAGFSRISDCVYYEENDNREHKKLFRLILTNPVEYWKLLPRCGVRLNSITQECIEELINNDHGDKVVEIVVNELKDLFGGSEYDPDIIMEEINAGNK